MIYVASRTKHADMWRELRAYYPINSSWIDEAGPNESDLTELWERILKEIREARALVLYVRPDDFPLKGAMVEVGMAIALGRPIIISAIGVEIEMPSRRPIGSWIEHPQVIIYQDRSAEACLKQAVHL